MFIANQAQSDARTRFRNDRRQELRKLQARIQEAMIAAQQANDFRVLTFLNEVETQAATLLLRESRRPRLCGTVERREGLSDAETDRAL